MKLSSAMFFFCGCSLAGLLAGEFAVACSAIDPSPGPLCGPTTTGCLCNGPDSDASADSDACFNLGLYQPYCCTDHGGDLDACTPPIGWDCVAKPGWAAPGFTNAAYCCPIR